MARVAGETEGSGLRRLIWRERLMGLAATVLRNREDPDSPEAWGKGAPMLLYHRVTAGSAAVTDPISVDLDAFERQVEWLRAKYTLVTAAELTGRLRGGKSVASLAAITFDDGYECTFSRAWPALRSRSVPATLFVDTARLNGPRPALRDDELRTMASEGLEIGSHSVSHRELTTLDDSTVKEELASSRERLAALIGGPVRGFAHPFGRYDMRTVRLVERAGYEYACTCRQHRTNHSGANPYLLNRVEINQGDGPRRFEDKVRGRYAGVYAAWYRLNPATRPWLQDR